MIIYRNMPQESVWDREYKKSKLLTKENKPQADVVKFIHFLKEKGLILENSKVLDLGSGTGRNSLYFASFGAKVIGFEISKTAIEIAQKYLIEAKNKSSDDILRYIVRYEKQSIGERFPLEDDSVDIVLDVTSSNSLSESEREVYLAETNRVLKKGGYFFVKALCKEGDSNAKYLLKNSPGLEKDTYIMPDLGVIERVWNKEDFISTYKKYFTILNLEKKTNYSRMNGRVYKRNFWLAYMKKI